MKELLGIFDSSWLPKRYGGNASPVEWPIKMEEKPKK